MIRAFHLTKVVHIHHIMPKRVYSIHCRLKEAESLSSSSSSQNWPTFSLAQDWTCDVQAVAIQSNDRDKNAVDTNEVTMAIARSLPLLEDSNSVPFVCRYRADLIAPLSVPQVHFLSAKLIKHRTLAPLRNKLLAVAPVTLHRRITASTSKSELEDLFAPYKPPSTGSIADRIKIDHPELVDFIEGVWSGQFHVTARTLTPIKAAIHLMATKISSDPRVVDQLTNRVGRDCRIKIAEGDDKEQKY
jgi:Tex-like protein N-terminal domain